MADSFGKYQLPELPFAAQYFGYDGQWRGDPSNPDVNAPDNDGKMPTIFSKENCVPASMGGKPPSRHLLNKLGYLATIGTYLDRVGYPYGNTPLKFDNPDTENSQNAYGYPKGAIISIYDETHKCMREYVSLVDNNMDDAPWTYMDGTTADGDVTEAWYGNDNWKPLYRMEQYSYFPDYSNMTEIFNETFYKSDSIKIPITGYGWIYVRRYIPEFATLPMAQVLRDADAMKVDIKIGDTVENTLTATTIMPYEGAEASRLIPVSDDTLSIHVNNTLGIVSEDNTKSAGSIQLVVSRLGFEGEESVA